MNTVFISKALLPITRRQNLDSSKLKEFADDNFKFDENGRKLSEWVGNTVRKGEISPFPTVFSKGLIPRGVKRCHCVGMVNAANSFLTDDDTRYFLWTV